MNGAKKVKISKLYLMENQKVSHMRQGLYAIFDYIQSTCMIFRREKQPVQLSLLCLVNQSNHLVPENKQKNKAAAVAFL